ncbi:MAG: glycosyltransferase family 9 protein [Pseudomonadota bacterium]
MHSLVIKLSSLGDVIQSFGAVADIAATSDRTTVLTTSPYQGLFSQCPHVDGIIIDRRLSLWHGSAHLALFRELRRLDIDRVIDLQNTRRTALYHRLFFSAIPFSGRSAQRNNPCGDRVRRHDPILDKLAEQLEMAQIPAHRTRQPDLSWLKADISALPLPSMPFVVLFAGSSVKAASYKRWPSYHALVDALAARDIPAVMIPGPAEIDEVSAFRGQVLLSDHKPLSIPQVAEVLRRAAFVVGNDTGLMHLAAHLRCYGLVLFSGMIAPRQTSVQTERLGVMQAAQIGDIELTAVLARIEKALGVA